MKKLVVLAIVTLFLFVGCNQPAADVSSKTNSFTSYDLNTDVLGYYGLNIDVVRRILGADTITQTEPEIGKDSKTSSYKHTSGIQFDTLNNVVTAVFINFSSIKTDLTIMGIGGKDQTRETIIKELGEPVNETSDGILYDIGDKQTLKFFLGKGGNLVAATACYNPPN